MIQHKLRSSLAGMWCLKRRNVLQQASSQSHREYAASRWMCQVMISLDSGSDSESVHSSWHLWSFSGELIALSMVHGSIHPGNCLSIVDCRTGGVALLLTQVHLFLAHLKRVACGSWWSCLRVGSPLAVFYPEGGGGNFFLLNLSHFTLSPYKNLHGYVICNG